MQEINICVVDDDPGDLSLMERILKGEGYYVYTSSNAEELYRILENEDIHIVILDVLLPDKTGYEVCREIRKKNQHNSIQVVLISGVEDADYHEKALEAGADDFIKKPFSVLELQFRIKAAVIRWRNQQSLLQEREFYRKAVAEEERLSSIVLDQNRYLKEANEKIRKLNEELARANKELEKIASYDMLSGLLNRRSLESKISIEIERAVRLNVPLSGIMIDIDHFKHVNDNYGHQCGDLVIMNIGKICNSQLRKYDYAGRYGGEEFFIILPNTKDEQALHIARRFKEGIEDLSIKCEDEIIKVTVSMGIAQFNPEETRAQWIKRADQAMYRAKQTGRNRIVLS